MARARNIKPGFFRNEVLAELPPLTRILFAGLWTVADKAGRLEDRPKRIKADVLPYDDGDVDQMLAALHEAGFVVRYSVGKNRYIQVSNFDKHQNPHTKEAESEIPAPGEHGTSTVQEPDEHNTNPADSLNTDSPISDSPTPSKRVRAKTSNYSDEFETFWQAYPSGHSDKKPTWEEWERLAPDDALQTTILDALEAWKQSDRWQRGLIRSAQRWLKERSWESIPAPPTSLSVVGDDYRPKPVYYDRHGNYTVEGAAARARGEIG